MKGPVRQVQEFEAPRKTLGQAPSEQEWRRTQQHHLQPSPAPCVLVPQTLDRLCPIRDLLHLVQDEKCALGPRITGHQPRRVPLLRDPLRATQGRLVGACKAIEQTGLLGDLCDQGGLAHLPRPGDDLEKTARLLQTVEQVCGARSRIR